jgi:hypothetical protein
VDRKIIKLRLEAILREGLTQLCESANKRATEPELDNLVTILAARVDDAASAIAALPNLSDQDKSN